MSLIIHILFVIFLKCVTNFYNLKRDSHLHIICWKLVSQMSSFVFIKNLRKLKTTKFNDNQ